MAKILIPTPLRKFTNDQSNYEASAATVGEAISQLTGQYPGIKQHLYDESGAIRSFIKVFVGEDDIRDLDNEKTSLSGDTVISIVPAIAGGIQ